MSIFNTPLGMSVVHNPLTDSIFVQQNNVGFSNNPLPDGLMITEDNNPMITEAGDYMIVE